MSDAHLLETGKAIAQRYAAWWTTFAEPSCAVSVCGEDEIFLN